MKVVQFVMKRLAFGLGALIAISIAIFVVTQALPADPAKTILGRDATPESLASLREVLGLNKSLLSQYTNWLGEVFRGDFGTSFTTQMSVSSYLGPRFGNSLFLMVIGAVFSIPISILLGALQALKRDTRFDSTASFASLVMAALPEFVMGTALIVIFATSVFQWFPAVVFLDEGARPWNDLNGVVLPITTLVLGCIPYVSRTTRASMIEVLESDYVEMARLKGLSERKVLLRHALPNALGPVLQVSALNIAYLVGGAVIVERLFNYPGVGSALTEAIAKRDLPVIQFLSLLIGGVYVLTNLVADVATVLVTPRLRTSL
jgi:peptide/nickel transport system permease protein